MERRLIVKTDPPGAQAFLDGAPVGTTPLDRPFTFYGSRELILRKKGFRTLKSILKVAPPFHQHFPIDLLADLLPWPLVDQHPFQFQLVPYVAPEKGEIMDRAGAARARMVK